MIYVNVADVFTATAVTTVSVQKQGLTANFLPMFGEDGGATS